MKNILIILGVIFIFIAGMWVAGQIIKSGSNIEQIEKVKFDSLQVEYIHLKISYDSVVRIQIDNEQNFVELTQDQNERINIYRKKIKGYEKDFSFIDDMSKHELMDSITGYYHRRFGYNR